MAGNSAGAHKGWETRWENDYLAGKELSPKGQAFIEEKFGPEIGSGSGGGGGGGGRGGGRGEEFYDGEEWPDYEDVFDFDIEY